MNTTKQIINKKEVMIMTKKMTKKEMFTMVAKVVENSEVEQS